jgi:hypothetical protein
MHALQNIQDDQRPSPERNMNECEWLQTMFRSTQYSPNPRLCYLTLWITHFDGNSTSLFNINYPTSWCSVWDYYSLALCGLFDTGGVDRGGSYWEVIWTCCWCPGELGGFTLMQFILIVSCRSPILGNPDPSTIPRQDEKWGTYWSWNLERGGIEWRLIMDRYSTTESKDGRENK